MSRNHSKLPGPMGDGAPIEHGDREHKPLKHQRLADCISPFDHPTEDERRRRNSA